MTGYQYTPLKDRERIMSKYNIIDWSGVTGPDAPKLVFVVCKNCNVFKMKGTVCQSYECVRQRKSND